MREGEEGASGKSVPRFPKAAALLVSGMILCAPAAFSLAEIAPDNVPKAQGTDNAAVKSARPPSGGIGDTAAIKDVISRAITSFGKDVIDAYHRELIKNSKIEGEITVSFTVRTSGDVADVKVEESSLNWPPLEEEDLEQDQGLEISPVRRAADSCARPLQVRAGESGEVAMINVRKHSSMVLLYEAAAFLVIIALSWLDELIGLPYLLFGGAPHLPDFRESAMETVAVLVIAAPILLLSRQLISRLFYLESFLKVCAWCKKVSDRDRWVPMDVYFAAEFNQRTTHGMCPDCFEKMKGENP